MSLNYKGLAFSLSILVTSYQYFTQKKSLSTVLPTKCWEFVGVTEIFQKLCTLRNSINISRDVALVWLPHNVQNSKYAAPVTFPQKPLCCTSLVS